MSQSLKFLGYVLGSRGVVAPFPVGVTVSSLIQGIASHPAAHPASCSMSDVGSFPKVKLNWREADHPSRVALRLGISGSVSVLSHVYLQSMHSDSLTL